MFEKYKNFDKVKKNQNINSIPFDEFKDEEKNVIIVNEISEKELDLKGEEFIKNLIPYEEINKYSCVLINTNDNKVWIEKGLKT